MIVPEPLSLVPILAAAAFSAVPARPSALPGPLEDVVLRTRADSFSLAKDGIDSAGLRYLPLRYADDDEVCDVRIAARRPLEHPGIEGSSDFQVVDSLVRRDSLEWSFKIRFSDLTESEFLRIRIHTGPDSTRDLLEIPVLPLTKTTVQLDTAGQDLHLGQEKAVEILSSNPYNIAVSPNWVQADGFQYRVARIDDRLFLHVLPTALGTKAFSIPLPTRKPDLVGGRPGPRSVELSGSLTFRKASLAYLKMDPQVVLVDDRSSRDGMEVQLEDGRVLQVGRTYLLEESSTAGGPPVAELFAKERLAIHGVLCILRAFNSHRRTAGSLFLKEGDATRAITNLDILPRVRVDKVQVMRNGKDWEDDAVVHPGETVHVRLEGQSLDQAKFGFGELAHVADVRDQSTENVFECGLRIPLEVSRSNIPVLDHDHATGRTLQVREFSKAHPFDYVSIDCGDGPVPLTSITGPQLCGHPIRDVVVRFDPGHLDSDAILYGKQYLKVDIKVSGPSGNLLDFGTVSDVVVCPDSRSKRSRYYDRSDCKGDPMSLNEKLATINTWDLPGWSKISLTFSNPEGHHDPAQPPRKVDIYRQERTKFDVDVSFPLGLLVHKFGEGGWGSFSGLSMAMMAKLGFYESGSINKREPWELAAGFIAVDAFDLSRSASDRDLAVVGLATLNPVNPDRKLSFPIYFGGGYLVSSHNWFWLLGPGISVQF